MRVAVLLIAVVFLGVASPARAWNEPDSFLGIKWGETSDAGLTALREQTRQSECNAVSFPAGPQTHCRGVAAFGTTVLLAHFRFNEAGFSWVFGSFATRDYETLRTAFVEKYGEPTSRSYSNVVTRAGQLKNEVLEWLGDKVVLRLSQIGARVTDGRFEALTRTEEDNRTERWKARQQRGKGAL